MEKEIIKVNITRAIKKARANLKKNIGGSLQDSGYETFLEISYTNVGEDGLNIPTVNLKIAQVSQQSRAM